MDADQDAILVQRAQNGDEKALITLYQNYINPIYRYAYCWTGNRSAAEDITSEVFLNMVKNLKQFKGTSSFKNWLYGITKHVIADYWRLQYKNPTTPIDNIPEVKISSPELQTDSDDIEQELAQKKVWAEKILNKLPDHYRRVLELRFMKNYTLQETADELKISLPNAKVIQHRALKKAYQLSQNL